MFVKTNFGLTILSRKMQRHNFLFCILVSLSLFGTLLSSEDGIVHDSDLDQLQRVSQELNDTSKHAKYLLYEVNPGEGFNLRRDVYIRVANLVKYMKNQGDNIVLVLPPWRGLYHWKSGIAQGALPWKKFFDTKNMNRYVPVIEFNTFLQLQQSPGIDMIVYLQRHPDGFSNGWEEKIEDDKCTDNPVYWKDADGTYHGYFWGLEYVYGKRFKCVSVQGSAKLLADYIKNANARSIFIDRFEEVLHIAYGDSEFWRARRSLVFAKPLRKRADKFRLEYLNSTDESDLTPYNDEDWRLQVPKDGSAIGGEYLAVHMRRGDFVFSGRKGVPTIKAVRKQISKLLKKLKLKVVFLATDGSDKEIEELQSKLEAKIVKYRPSEDEMRKYGDGGIAIIDQWIAAHGRYFIGSCESTFSFRIHEERDILGFHPDVTFNCFCTEKEIGKCEQPTQWRVQFS